MNIIVLGISHSGTTITTKMLQSLGWNVGDADDYYCESEKVRLVNENLLCKTHVGDINENFFAEFRQPWVIKDPRFVFTLSYWATVFQSQSIELPFVLFVQRENTEVLNSYKGRGEDSNNFQYGRLCGGKYMTSVPKQEKAAEVEYEAWKGPKCIVQYEDIAKAVSLFRKN